MDETLINIVDFLPRTESVRQPSTPSHTINPDLQWLDIAIACSQLYGTYGWLAPTTTTGTQQTHQAIIFDTQCARPVLTEPSTQVPKACHQSSAFCHLSRTHAAEQSGR